MHLLFDNLGALTTVFFFVLTIYFMWWWHKKWLAELMPISDGIFYAEKGEWILILDRNEMILEE